MSNLTQQRCVPCEGGVPPLTSEQITQHLKDIDGWTTTQAGNEIVKDFHFKDYYHCMAFVNAVAYMAHFEGHHPDMEVGYNHCLVRYSTHAIGGLSHNDFICAAKVDQLYQVRDET